MIYTYDKFYRKFGLRRSTDFVYPKVMKDDTIPFPRYTTFHFYKEDPDVYPTKDITLFSNYDTGFVVNILKYKNPEYTAKEKFVSDTALANMYKSKYKDFITLPYNKAITWLKTKKNIAKKKPFIFNYSLMNKYYRYPTSPIYDYYKYKNVVNTIISNILELQTMDLKQSNKLEHYVIIDLPNTFYKYDFIHRYLDRKINAEVLKAFYNWPSLNVLMLFKSIFKDLYKETPVGLINTTNQLKTINLLITLGEKVLIINLEKLLAFSKEWEELNNSTKYGSTKLAKLLHFALNAMYLLPAFNSEEIDKDNYSDVITDKLNISKTTTKGITENTKVIDVSSINDLTEKQLDEIVDKSDKEIDTTVIDDENMVDNIANNTIDTTEDIENINPIEKPLNLKELNLPIDNAIDMVKRDLLNTIDTTDTKTRKKIEDSINNLLNTESPYKDGKLIKELTNITDRDINISIEDKKLPNAKVVTIFNPNDAEDTITALDKKYIKDVMKKDIVSAIVSLQRAGMLIKDYEINKVDSILGEYEDHIITFNDINKGNFKVTIKIPTVNEDGNFSISGNQYLLRKTRTDIPIKKITYNRVSLNSAYGKLFIDKAPYSKLSTPVSIKKQLIKLQKNGKIKNLVGGSAIVSDVKLPQVYSMLMTNIKSFSFNGMEFNFSYPTRKEILPNNYKLEDIEKDNKVLCGIMNKKPIVMDDNGDIYLINKTTTLIGNFYDIIGIDINKLVNEFSLVKIYKTYIPTIYLLLYYNGLFNVLKSLNIKYKVLEGNKRINSSPNNIVVKFKHSTLVIEVNNPKDKMLLYGLNYYKKEIKNIPIDLLNSKDGVLMLFNDLKIPLNIITEIQLMNQLFVDSVTANVLKQMKEPTSFIGLLLRANEMLVDNYFMHPQSLNGYVIRGYEKIPQMIYNKMVESIRAKKNEEYFGRSRLVFDPYSVWRILNEDSASILRDDINPIAYLKQKEDVTYLGFLGRKKESMSKSTRELHPDDIGVISEANKDSGDVGITAYMSANPVLKNIRGMKDNVKELNASNIFSTSVMLAPFSDRDDSKRINFISIMNSHIVPLNNATTYPVRTGYDAILPYRLPKKFIAYADDTGKVISVSKNKIIVEYNTKGRVTYNFNNWYSKEESHVSYEHIMKSNVIENQKLNVGDVIYYDNSFFEPDMFDSTKVTYKAFLTVKTAMLEVNETYEDSCAISEKLSSMSDMSYIKSRNIILDCHDDISNVVNIGDKVNPATSLFTIGTGTIDTNEFDEEALNILEGFIKNTPKAKIKGTVSKIEVYYNCDKDNMSDSIKELVDKAEKTMINPNNGKKYIGKVNSSYSIDGKPLQEGKIEIKIYIKVVDDMGTGDKAIFTNQLKTTVGDVYNYPIVGEDGEEIDALFSMRAVMARIVNSPNLMGTTATLLKKVTNKAVEIYFGKGE